MSEKKYKILVISSYPPSRSAGLVQDNITALEEDGHIVDYFTMYSFPGQKSNQYSICNEPVFDKLKRLMQKYPILKKFKKTVRFFLKSPEEKTMTNIDIDGYRIPHLDENKPIVDNDTLLKKLPNKSYDFAIVYILERMITTVSLKQIYKKYRCPILIACMDNVHFTGGCYFFGKCERYQIGCGKCPVLKSEDENDQTHVNYLTKKKVFSEIEYAIMCNQYQKQFALKCNLFDPMRIFTKHILIDENVFVPKDETEVRRYFKIPETKKKVIYARYEKGMGRAKGYDHMANIINLCYDKMMPSERDESIFVMVGSPDEQYARQIKMDTFFLGYLDLPKLVKSYSVASVFISTSIDDAGPSMVNQSMMCGTPVVTFSIGTALQVTQEGVNGYMVENFNDEMFADRILQINRLSNKDHSAMKDSTRASALLMNSRKANAHRLIEIYREVLKMQ